MQCAWHNWWDNILPSSRYNGVQRPLFPLTVLAEPELNVLTLASTFLYKDKMTKHSVLG